MDILQNTKRDASLDLFDKKKKRLVHLLFLSLLVSGGMNRKNGPLIQWLGVPLERSKENDLDPSLIYTLSLTHTHRSKEENQSIKRTKRMQAFSLFINVLLIVLAIGYIDAFTRNDFPEDFLFGSATSAYQVRLCLYVLFHFLCVAFV